MLKNKLNLRNVVAERCRNIVVIATCLVIATTIWSCKNTGSGKSSSSNVSNEVTNNDKGSESPQIKAIKWTVVENKPFRSKIQDIVRGDKIFVIGKNNEIAYSTSGVEWTTVTTELSRFFPGGLKLPGSYEMLNIAYGNGVFVALDGSGTAAYANESSITEWSNAPAVNGEGQPFFLGVPDTGGAGVPSNNAGISFGKNVFVAHRLGRIKYSENNGETWENTNFIDEETSPFKYISRIACSGSRFVAVGGSTSKPNTKGTARIAYSDDGKEWIEVTDHPFNFLLENIIWDGTNFITFHLVTDYETSKWDGRVAHSEDGITWNVVNTNHETIPGHSWLLCYGGGTYINGFSDELRYSNNGKIWIKGEKIPDAYPTFSSIAYGDKKFVIVGWEGFIAYSNNIE